MRKGFGIGLTVLGGFLVTLAILAQFWAPGRLMKTPLDVDSLTLVQGDAQLANGTGSTDDFPVKAFSVTRADSERSDSDVIVFENSSCLVKDEGDIDECVSASDPEERLISASTDSFATDRRTAEAVDDPKYLPPSAEEKSGLVNKWPFEAEKKTYQYWDGFAGEAVPATYEGTEDYDGLELYVYKTVVEDVPIEVAAGVQGTYSTDKTFWIEPETGTIVNQFENQVRLDGEGNTFLALNDFGFTDDQVKKNADESGSNASSLKLISGTVPLIGWIVGIPALLIGIALQLMRRRSAASA
jgi:hypothetical protein